MFKVLASTLCAAICIMGASSSNAASVTLFSGTTVDSSQLANTGYALPYEGTNSSLSALGSGVYSTATGWIAGGASLVYTIDSDVNSYDSFDIDNAFAKAGVHAYMEVSWANQVLTNGAGADFEIGESGSAEGVLASVKVAGGSWTNWMWVLQSPGGANYYGQYDLSNFGLSGDATVEAIRLTNTVVGQTTDDFGHTMIDPATGGTFVASHCDSDPNYIAALSTLETPPVPEPMGLISLGSGALGLLGFAIRRRRA